MAFVLTSTAFKEGEAIPTQFTCDGTNISPPLSWSGVPDGTQSLALLVNDPDAPSGTFTHWVLFDLTADSEGLPENRPNDQVLENGARQGTNDFGSIGYGGPCPPTGHGSHRYFFRLYALDAELTLNKSATGEDFLAAVKDHIIAETHLMGNYERQQAKTSEARS